MRSTPGRVDLDNLLEALDEACSDSDATLRDSLTEYGIDPEDVAAIAVQLAESIRGRNLSRKRSTVGSKRNRRRLK
jgi:hypothetical protein